MPKFYSMGRFSIFVSLFVLCLNNLISQNYSLESDKILVQFDAQNKPFIQHQVSKGQTIFYLRYRFGLSEAEFLSYNPQIKDKKINVAQWVNLPVGHLMQYSIESNSSKNYKTVYYKVKAQENINSICRNRTQWDSKFFTKQNKILDNKIQESQILKIGYLIDFNSVTKENTNKVEIENKTNNKNIVADSMLNTKLTKNEFVGHRLNSFKSESRGVAISVGPDNGKYYALHNKAKRGSMIEIYNPVIERSVLAKVISKIPNNYTNDIQVVVSTSVGNSIGAIGNKFFVYVRH